MARTSGSADYTFQKIASGLPAKLSTDEARKWLRQESQKITQVNAVRFMNTADKDRYSNYLSKKDIGKMFMFWYDAKLKKTASILG
jgi:hypothetical protein